MALNLDKEYTERPEDQTKCVYYGKSGSKISAISI